MGLGGESDAGSERNACYSEKALFLLFIKPIAFISNSYISVLVCVSSAVWKVTE